MGHIVNPISFRLGLNRTWNSSWVASNGINYSYLIQRDIFIYNFLALLFNQINLINEGFLYSHSRILAQVGGRFMIINYIYEQSLFLKYTKLLPLINLIICRLIKRLNLSKLGFIDLNVQSVSLVENKKFITVFLDKFYKFMFYYLIKLIYIKPMLYSFKLLNIIILEWLRMVSNKCFNYDISYVFLSLNQVTPQIISLYIAKKLKQRHMLLKIVKPLFKNLDENPLILGYKISCSGRFTRKQRATYYWVKSGLIPFNKVSSVIDYSYRNKVLPFGACGIKVWLCRTV